MTTSSDTSRPESTAGPIPSADDRPRLRGPIRKLFLWYIPAILGMQIVWGGVLGVLLPFQIGEIDDANKVANLAIVSTVGAILAMIAQPIAGAVSDRVRSRFGRRAPIIVIGVGVGALALLGLAVSTEVWQIAVAWAFVQFFYNFAQGPITTIVPDRVPHRLRGAFSAVIGAMLMVGGVIGGVGAGAFLSNAPLGFAVIAGLSFLLVFGFVFFNRDASSRDLALEPFSIGKFLSAFWVNPVKHRDFFWAFGGRLLLYAGYFAVTGYNVFLLQDYVGLGPDGAAIAPLVFAAGLPTTIIAVLIFGPLSDRLGRRKVFVIIAAVIVAIGELVPWFMPDVTGMILMAVITGFGFGAFQSVDTALITEVLPDEKDFGKDIGVLNIAATLPQALGPALAGGVVLAFGYAGLFPVGVALSLIGAAFVLPIKSVR